MKNILLAIRMLLRFRVYTFINLLGLILSLTCALIIARYIHQEYTVDHYCPELDRTFLMTIVEEGKKPQLSGAKDYNNDPNFIDPLNDPMVERYSRFIVLEDDPIEAENGVFYVNNIVTDSFFLPILGYPISKGAKTIRQASDVIISERLATKLYPNQDPLGKILKSSTGTLLTVIGVLGKPNTKSSFQFDIVTSVAQKDDWRIAPIMLLQLYNADMYYAFNERNQVPMQLKYSNGKKSIFQLLSLKAFYFDKLTSQYSFSKSLVRGDIHAINILLMVAILILIVGCFNYLNLNSVIMLYRSREFSLKKVYGANGFQVVKQLYLENLFIGIIALLFVWTIVEVSNGLMTKLMDIEVQLNWKFDLFVSLLVLICLPLFISVFPYIQYHYSKPITALQSINKLYKSVFYRTIFICFQYAVTIILAVMAIYFSRQLDYIQNYELNFRKADIVNCHLLNNKLNSMTTEVLANAEVVKMQNQMKIINKKLEESCLFTEWTYGGPPINRNYKLVFKSKDNNSLEVLFCIVGESYMNVFDFKLLEGRFWNTEMDNYRDPKLIISETVKDYFKFDDLASANLIPNTPIIYNVVGTQISRTQDYSVIGVIEDIKINHLSQKDYPVVFVYGDSHYGNKLIASIAPGKKEEAIALLDKLYHEINGEGEFTYTFLDDDIAALYKEDKRRGNIYVSFAIIAILISCLGLFGLSLYDIRQRYREIAIRKINGASEKVIVVLLLRKYFYMFLFALIVGSSTSYIIIVKYMESYTNKAPLSAWIFIVAILITAFISVCTLWWQIRKAVRINPADVLRGE